MSPQTFPDYHDTPGQSTFLFAPEIERALIGLVWREPDRLAQVKRELDPALHFIQPNCRYLLEAIELAYGELGAVDFATVIQVLRELGRLEDAGGLEGANDLYRVGEFLDSPIWDKRLSDRLFAHYLQSLKDYAQRRDRTLVVVLFVDGKATLLQNKVKRHAWDPHFIGEAKIASRLYAVRAWTATDGSFLNFSFQLKK